MGHSAAAARFCALPVIHHRRRSALSTRSRTRRHARRILTGPLERPSRRKPTSSSPRHPTSTISTLSPTSSDARCGVAADPVAQGLRCRLWALFRPVGASACVGFGTDRTVSTAASGCEGTRVNGPRRHIRAGVAPTGHKNWSGGRFDPAAALASQVLGHRTAGPI
jgi:hypothetical protein